ncbi:WD40-repeat-containing domain protein [Phakopsora pachyrhizi]|nr:WD40-repeat-containing domain protein [Phakopsora pachyrhizi]
MSDSNVEVQNDSCKTFKLSSVLKGHSQDIKSLKFIDYQSIYSCSRDSTTRVWKREDENSWSERSLYQNSNPGFLNAVERITLDGDEFLLSAGQDSLIQLWPISPKPGQDYKPSFILSGHSSNVCYLNVLNHLNPPTIYSGSWDCTAIVWRNKEIVHRLTAHSAAVWSVIGLDERRTLTGAADNLIFLWDRSDRISVFKGHTQAVRALVRLDNLTFASASNDASIRLWSIEDNGQALRVFDRIHDSFIYSLDILSTGELVSSGEDRSVRVWDPRNGLVNQTITIPAISVWTVSVCRDNDDIVCGSSDSLIRVFSRSERRWASNDEIVAFEDSVRASTVPSATVDNLKKSDLPTIQALLSRTGKKEGEVAMAKNEANGAVEAYQWDAARGDWTMVGTVVDGTGSSDKKLYEGKEYDYVFDVDIQDGVPPLKLPYNVSENPYTVAQKWLAKHKLPDSYLDQVVDFIDKNTSGVSIGGKNVGSDPYTGSNSYRPSSNSNNGNVAGRASLDPFTGDGSYKAKQYDSSGTGLELSLNDLNSILNFINLISSSKDRAINQDDSCYQEGLKVIHKVVADWPIDKKFPGIDLIRVISMDQFPIKVFDTLKSLIESISTKLSSSDEETSDQKNNELNLTLILRSFSNGVYSEYDSKKIKKDHADDEFRVKLFESLWDSEKSLFKIEMNILKTKNCKVSLVTLILK